MFVVSCSDHSGLLLKLVRLLVQNVTPHGVLYTLNHIVTRVPKLSVLEDKDSTCLEQNVVTLLHVVRMKRSRATF